MSSHYLERISQPVGSLCGIAVTCLGAVCLAACASAEPGSARAGVGEDVSRAMGSSRSDAGMGAQPASDAGAEVEPAVDAMPPAADAGESSEDAGGGVTVQAPMPSVPTTSEIPSLLSEAGLYEADMQTLAPGVRSYWPRFELWSDGAAKQRWVYLPEGSQIDSSSMEYWSYPAGTRLYKEFSVDGVRVETRLLERQENGAWWMMAYHWREDQSDADAVPDGLPDASGTAHDVPSTDDCRTCHLRMPDKVIGFSAIQLSHETEPEDAGEWSLSRLNDAGLLTDAPPEIQLFPEDELGQRALGYLHANCGHCHQPRSSVSSRVSLSLWLRTDSVEAVSQTPSYTSTVGQAPSLLVEGSEVLPALITPGAPNASALLSRVQSRQADFSMPPLATEQVDEEAVALLREWIESLPEQPPLVPVD